MCELFKKSPSRFNRHHLSSNLPLLYFKPSISGQLILTVAVIQYREGILCRAGCACNQGYIILSAYCPTEMLPALFFKFVISQNRGNPNIEPKIL